MRLGAVILLVFGVILALMINNEALLGVKLENGVLNLNLNLDTG